MERIIYRKTLDVHKSGIQFTLQGFQTADNMSRSVELSLMASGDTIDLPLEQLMAVMYVTTPNAAEPSINHCTIKDNIVVCDIPPVVEEGITEIQIKLIETRPDGAIGVLATPKFAIEVSKSDINEESATQNTTFTALEQALAQAKGVYDSRVTRIVLSPDCIFNVHYADGTVYTSDALKDVVVNGESLVSKSYARGGTGIRAGEDTDNSMYYSNESKSASLQSTKAREESEELLEEVKKHSIHTEFTIDFETGTIKYASQLYSFNVNEETGQLDIFGDSYTPNANIEEIVINWLEELYDTNNESLNGINTRFDHVEANIKNINDQLFPLQSGLAVEQTKLNQQITRIDQTWEWSNSALARLDSHDRKLQLNDQFDNEVMQFINNHSNVLENHTFTLTNHTSQLSNLATAVEKIINIKMVTGTTNSDGNLWLASATDQVNQIPIACKKQGYIITPYISENNEVMAHVTTVGKDATAVVNGSISGIEYYYIRL